MSRRLNGVLILPAVFMIVALMACSLGGSPSANATLASSALATGSSLQQIPLISGATPTPSGSETATPSNLGTQDEALTMLQAAIEHYQTVGRDQALADFTNRVDPFFYKDLYVACIDSDLKQSANGGFPDLVGSTVQPLSQANWDAATTTDVGTTDYTWIDPATNAMLPKTFYYERVGQDVCGVGAYHP